MFSDEKDRKGAARPAQPQFNAEREGGAKQARPEEERRALRRACPSSAPGISAMPEPAKYDDYPIEQCAEEAAEKIAAGAVVFQKRTCRHCGSRQTMNEPNTFFTSGRCEECRQVTEITNCNYMVIVLR
jgi:hypothetical protein